MIDPQTFATWMGKLADRWNRPLLPPTSQAYYAQLSPLLSTAEFERAAAIVFRDEQFPWPAPRVFLEKVRSNAPPTYRALGPGVTGQQTFGGGCFEVDKHNRLVQHEVTCGCGRTYLQYCLSIPWLEAISDGARREMLREFPIGRCPTECPSCARKILATGISYPERPRQRETPEWAA